MRFSPIESVQLAVPHIQQEKGGDCLAICIEMVLTYLGVAVTRGQLAKTLRIQPNAGAPFHNIEQLEKLGILVGYRHNGTLETLYTLLRHGWPSIASVFTGPLPYWDIGTGHAIVVVGMDSEHIFLNDPSFPKGPIQVLLGDFDLAGLSRVNSTLCWPLCKSLNSGRSQVITTPKPCGYPAWLANHADSYFLGTASTAKQARLRLT